MTLADLKKQIKGDLFTDAAHRILYATDASAYRELPLAVTRPRDNDDIREIISYARSQGLSVIPRGAGTSVAGQVVGKGIVIDISRYMNNIIEFNPAERWVKVQPGVVLAELNRFLAPYNLQFGPETSTANRCCLGGMLGNNSCGLHSIIYGSVRDHILETEVILSDGSETSFKALTTWEFNNRCEGDPSLLETQIYRNLRDILSDPSNAEEIRKEFPHPDVKRRNNGYAIDILLETDPFASNGEKINICKLLAGSEGTLAFTTSMKINLLPLPEQKNGLVCAHFSSLDEAVRANIIALKYKPASIEMIDDYILNCTKENIEQNKNRFFVKGDPKIILMIEIFRDTIEEVKQTAEDLEKEIRKAGYGYHFPLFTEPGDIAKVWELRKAGLGVLLIIPGPKKSIQLIEDTAVLPDFFPDYIAEFQDILKKYGLECSYYAHIATGELHLSPLLDLKDSKDVETYHNLALDIARLVKKYRGSLSGEHGDGRLRGEFIPLMLGNHNYSILKTIKHTWDPYNVLNPGKITDTPSMVESLRYLIDEPYNTPDTTFHFPEKEGILYAAEKCSGSGDCRKSSLVGGTMCPSFMATRDEDKSTRARANILREFLTRSDKKNPFDHREIYEIMDLCLSCKACKSECPSNVDMTKLKAEFLNHYYKSHHIPFRTLIIAYLPRLYKLGKIFRPVTNYLTGTSVFKSVIGFSVKRSIPGISEITLEKWAAGKPAQKGKNGKVYLFADEFTNYNESEIGIKAVMLLTKLGYEVVIPKHRESGRTFLSKGMLDPAKRLATSNVLMLKDIVTAETPLVGLEPSAILSFRDEYPEMVNDDLRDAAALLASNAMLFEEFICREADKGLITPASFTKEKAKILLHGHCQQKAVASTVPTKRMLSLPENYSVEEIPSGCCGMAGAFGYEKEHYELSMKIGEMVLLPAVRNADADTIISAPGTSCRHQIKDGTGRKALHPVEVLYNAIVNS